MQVGERARILELRREVPGDRAGFVEQEGMLTRRLNVPWDPNIGALWEVRFDDGRVEVFSESEMAILGPDGEPLASETDELRASWGDAPRTVSMRFRRFGGGAVSAPALLAFLVLVIAGALLVVAAVVESSLPLGAAGGGLILLAILSAALLVA